MANFPWYITSPGWAWAYEGGQAQRVPTRTRHAKASGHSLTACGLACDTWTKFWHLPYRSGQVGRSCASCDAAVRATVPRRPVRC